MVKSMTGYGTGSCTKNGFQFNVDIRSVNHRYLELNCRLARDLQKLEDFIRPFVKEKVSRGRLDIYIEYQAEELHSKEIEIDEKVAESYLKAIRFLEDSLGLEKTHINAGEILRFPEVATVKRKSFDLEQLWAVLRIALDNALKSLLIQREHEGERLKNDLLSRLERIKAAAAEIKKRSPFVVEEYRGKLQTRLKDLIAGEIDERRLLMEVALFAERSSITEEVVRLESHFTTFLEIVGLDEPIGRKLDFTLQEMFREINTIGSKASDSKITRLVVDIKSELEKMREQVQNIE
ncbi:MAG: YicC/YloC family endoribonuclease [Dethiobacteria bacterium]